MDNYNFYKSLYDRELNRRKDLDASINLPLTIIGILITGNTYIAKDLFPIRSIFDINLKHFLMLIFFLLIIFTVAYLTKSYNNFYKGFKYRNIGNYKELRDYDYKVVDYNKRINNSNKIIDFEVKIIDKFVDIAENHCSINDRRSYDLYIAKTMILFAIGLTLLNYMILIFK
jgi:hypothetical protein